VSERELLRATADYAADFIDTLAARPIRPEAEVEQLYDALGGPLPKHGIDPQAAIAQLVEAAEPGIVGIPSGRYFGFVIGGAMPAALAADWLTSTWDQNAGLYAGGPAAAVVEEVARGWLADLFGLPPDVSVAYVTGCQMAHVTALAAARHHVLAKEDWDVARDGLAGSPPIRVVVGAKRHVTLDRALRLLGIGASSVVVVPADDQGRMRLSELPDLSGGPTIVCGQAGEVNTGAFDDLAAIADAAEAAGAWFHVDGAMGLWVGAVPQMRHLLRGVERADSWATDAHKFLNVPYDSGIAFCAHPDAHRAAMSVTASYLVHSKDARMRDQVDWTPEFSRRARGFTTYAALRSLGRAGVAELVDRCCVHARRFAELLADGGATILNDVVLNQVLARFGDGERTREVIERVQADGTCWLSGTEWAGEHAMRISVSNWRTNEDDVERSAAAILEAAGADRKVLANPAPNQV
jgi:glutamate/tyrosine decarboxylase-like PLP-dependent enzyme